jgi:hypothetical protein
MSFLKASDIQIDVEKCLVSSLWVVNRIHSLLDPPKGTMYNAAFFTDTVMPRLIENVESRIRRKRFKGWLIRRDNVRPYHSGRAQRCHEASRAERLLRVTYSPDLAPHNFLLF